MSQSPERQPGPASPSPRAGAPARSFPRFDEARESPRVSRRELGLVELHVRAAGGRKWHPARLWDFSSTSVGFTLEAPTPLPVRIGGTLRIRLRLDRRQTPEAEVWVRTASLQRGVLKVGAVRVDVDDFSRLVDETAPDPESIPQPLTGRIPHAILYGHASPVFLSGIGPGRTFTLVSEDPALLLFSGCEVPVAFDLPEVMETPMTARVQSLRLDRAGRTLATFAARSIPRRLRAALTGRLPL